MSHHDKHHHCYLLQSLSSPSKTYVGYTVNPARRINQHNGIIKGGATYTSKSRPWKFIAIVHGFKTESDGLKFEWAFQHPKRSKIFRGGLGKNGRNRGSGMVLAEMLEKQRGLQGKLRLLMILLCESCYRNDQLTVYFFDEDTKFMFEDLFNNSGSTDYSSDESSSSSESDDDDDSANNNEEAGERKRGRGRRDRPKWCSALPKQMKALLVEDVKDLPMYVVEQGESSKKKRKKDTRTKSDADGLRRIDEKENLESNKSMDDDDDDDNEEDDRNFCHILDSSDEEEDHARNTWGDHSTTRMNVDGLNDDDDDESLLHQQIGRLSLTPMQTSSSRRRQYDRRNDNDDGSKSSGTIELLDTYDQDDNDCNTIGDMDYCIECNPMRPTMDGGRESLVHSNQNARQMTPIIDLTDDVQSPIMSSTPMHATQLEFTLDDNDDDSIRCEGDYSSSDGTIDLCSP